MAPSQGLAICLQGDEAYNEQAQAKDGQGLALTLTIWEQDCVVTVEELSKLPLPKLCKLYTVRSRQCVSTLELQLSCLLAVLPCYICNSVSQPIMTSHHVLSHHIFGCTSAWTQLCDNSIVLPEYLQYCTLLP